MKTVKKKRIISMSRRESRAGLAFITPSLVGFALFCIFPMFHVVRAALTKPYGGGFAGLGNFFKVAQSEAFQLGAWNTVRFTLVSVPLMLVLSFLLALLLHKRQKSALRSWIILPLVIPSASVVQFFFILFAEKGLTNRVLEALGLQATDWLHSPATFTVLVVLYIWKNLGYTVILLMAGLNGIPSEYGQAARSDGAGTWARMRYITLPLMVPTFFFVFIIALIRSFQVFREAYMITGNYPDDYSVYTLQHFFNGNFRAGNFQQLSVAALYVFFVISVFVYVLYRFRNRMEADIT